MQISKSVNVYDPDFYYERKFFLSSFTCARCKHKFMFEPGIAVYNIPMHHPKQYYGSPFPDKYCRICSKEKEEEILKTIESWTDPKIIKRYEELYGRSI